MTIQEKLHLLRAKMKEQNIDAFIVYSADPHMSEYLPLQWQERQWLSGFTGSYGYLVVTPQKAGLWTDGRYFTQAAEELEGSSIKMYKDRVVEGINYIDWIVEQTTENARVGVNAMATSHASWEDLKSTLTCNNRQLIDEPLLDQVWKDREKSEKNPVFVHPLKRAGRSVVQKIADIRKAIKLAGATAHVVSSLDDVAWTLNLRGSDIEFNPVFLGYLYITPKEVLFFVDSEQLTEEARQLMKAAEIRLQPYKNFFEELKAIKDEVVLLASNCNQAVFKALEKHNQLIKNPPPGNLMKAVKNETELKGFRTVMIRDGIAMVKFLYWLIHQVGTEQMTEYSIGKKLLQFRAEGQNFVGESFATIVGYRGNDALPHYKAKPESGESVIDQGSVLIDSGGQYLEGTTDITRTIPLGELTEDFKRDYTRVLKAYFALADAKFPKGTRGAQLDILARHPLWKEGKDFNHGTGHGVGSFLNVHEGPQSIRKEYNPFALQPGMVLSNEPGYYLENHYGIRHENLMVVQEFKTTQWNTFYEFAPLTYCPFFTAPLVREMLTEKELQMLNAYHLKCREKLAPHLEGVVKKWFLELVAPL